MIKAQKKEKGIARRLFRFLTPQWKVILLATIVSAVASGLEASIPVVVGMVIDILGGKENIMTEILNHLGFGEMPSSAVNILPIYILTLIAIVGLLSYTRTYLLSMVGEKTVVVIRERLFRRLIRLSLSYHNRIKKGDFISRVLSDVSTVQDTANSLKDIIHSAVMVIVILIVMFSRYWFLTILTIVTFPILVSIINRLSERMRTAGRNLQVKLGEIGAYLSEILSGIRIVKSFTRETYEDSRFKKINISTFRARMKTVKVEALLRPLMELCSGLGMVLVFWFGCRSVMSGDMTTGMLMEFIGLVMLMYQPIRSLGRVNTMLQRTIAASERIFEVIDEPEEIIEPEIPERLGKIKGRVEFRNVSFAYDNGRKVLHNINIEIEPYESVALVGPSGAGKSTLVNLIPRFYDVSDGSILVDGIDVRNVSLNELRRQIGIVPQEMILYGMTVKENILYGRLNATMDEVIESAKAANAHEFIMKMPQQYDTQIGEGGVLLSGGERQRLSIARAILSNPCILILDEATSSLDVESEALIKEALSRLIKNRTTFIIAHRLSTVVNVDRIVVMDKGRIVDIGTHNSLLRKGGLYARLCKAQLIS
ncbi:MAG: ABC transporter ATP-binding protein [Candidatus Coatesbacteria bacterium]|nr:MAG: ABC transporter ATP-binding protein [Candidatus Coatesbacteria bacterium]